MTPNSLTHQAIQAALDNNWPKAIAINLQILQQKPQDIEALSRLAKAYIQQNQNKLAAKTYRQVLKLDRFNPIAKAQLDQLKNHQTSFRKKKNHLALKPSLFLEEAGKTKEIILVNLAQDKALLGLSVGDPLKIIPRKKSISIYSQNNDFLGKIPDDLAFRLIKLIKNGNQYQALVKSSGEKSLTIFMRETKQGLKNKSQPSFPVPAEQYQSSALPHLIQREPLEEAETFTE